jgi:quercetin dioxygenase-like cupin family protein
MNVSSIVEELKQKYPGKNIVVNDPDNPSEIICEIEPAGQNPEKSVAIAVIDRTLEHRHGDFKQTYEVLRGKLKIKKGGKEYELYEGERIVIDPGEKHSAEGHGTWIKVTSSPGWSVKDHTTN